MTDRLYSRPEGQTEILADKLEKPLLDDRSYRVIRLPNQLEALLIHDPDTDKASAAMDVNVGSMADPEEMQGMAHAVEHALFMGTQKYPGENDYNSYLNKYGGRSNAFTAMTSTNYYFELSSSSKSNSPSSSTNTSQASLPLDKGASPLYGALDRFAQFFIAPLFLEDTLDRELLAVDSENKKNLQSDNWRLMQLAKSLSSKNHPYHIFATGNYKLLHDDPIARGVKVREEFMNFYKTHYSANRMKLAVIGNEDLDQLQTWVEEFFSPVVNQDLPKMRWDGITVFEPEHLNIQVFVKPVMQLRILDLMFPYPDEDDHYESHPSRYISHLIGHEGPGSLLAYLKDKGWANELSAGAQDICPGASNFNISIRLTSAGQEKHQEIIKAIFHYIAMMKEQDPQKWITDESAKLAEIDFRFRQKAPASRTTSNLSGVMQKPYPREWIMSGSSLIRKHDPVAIKRGLDALRPDNFRFILSSQDYPAEFDQREQWYGTEYRIEKFSPAFMQDIEKAYAATASERPAELHLPHKNEFLPTRLDVEKKEVSAPTLTPKLIRNDSNVRVWWKKDDTFWVPKANFYVGLRSPMTDVTPLSSALFKLYNDLVNDSLTTYAYDAELAGLAYGFDKANKMMEISVSGYNDKLHVLLEKVLITMRDLDFTDERFDIIKERLTRGLRNFELSEPYRQVNSWARWMYKERQWMGQDLLDVIPSITADQVRKFFPHVLQQMHIEILAHGNFYKEDALRISDMVEATLRPYTLPPSQWETERFFDFPPGSDYVYQHKLANLDNVNHCIHVTSHLGDAQDRPQRAKMLLMSQIMEEPVFDTLRSKEQLGYIVASGPGALGPHLIHWFLIQSEKNCEHLEQRIDNFLVTFEQKIRDMPAEEFESHRVGIINKRLEKLKNLNQESGRLWHHISSEQFDFELVYRDVEQLEILTKDEILDFYTTYMSPHSPHRARSSVHLIAQASPADVAAKAPSQLAEALSNQLVAIFSALGLPGDAKALQVYLEKVDIAKGDIASIKNAIGEYLSKGAGLGAEIVASVLEQAQQGLPQLLPVIGVKMDKTPAEPATNGTTEVATNGHTKEVANGAVKKNRVLVEDVKVFQAGLPLTVSSRPVKHISEFEETGSKL